VHRLTLIFPLACIDHLELVVDHQETIIEEQKDQVMRLEQELEHTALQLKEEQGVREAAEKDVLKTGRKLVSTLKNLQDTVVEKNKLQQQCKKLEGEVYRAWQAEQSLRIFIEDSISSVANQFNRSNNNNRNNNNNNNRDVVRHNNNN